MPEPKTHAFQFDAVTHATIIDALSTRGWICLERALPLPQIAVWRARLLGLQDEGKLRQAGVGRTQSLQRATQIRNDFIAWLESDSYDDNDRAAWLVFKALLESLNRELFLNLDHAEAHYALYAPGGFYVKHLDRHATSDARVISFILYLNETWQPEWGGQLKLYDEQDRLIETIEPLGGTLVLFLSERFPHEVVPAAKTRMSLTGWLRRRN